MPHLLILIHLPCFCFYFILEGATVRGALKMIPGCVAAEAVFAKSYAYATVNLERYGNATHKNDPQFMFDPSDEKLMSHLKQRVTEDTVETILLAAGKEAYVLERGDIFDVQQEDVDEETTQLVSESESIDSHEWYSSGQSKDCEYEVLLAIKGMNCTACARKVEGVLSKVPNVKSIQVNLTTDRVTVKIKKGENYDKTVGSGSDSETKEIHTRWSRL
jgi:copper chaperone CopZ